MSKKYDVSGLEAAMREMRKYSRKSATELVNHNLIKIALGSSNGKGLVHYTEKATAERIKSDMKKMVTVTGRDGRTNTVPLIIAIASAWLTKKSPAASALAKTKKGRNRAWQSQMKMACAKILRARLKSRQYIATGWLYAARDLASKVPGSKLTRLGKDSLPKKENWKGGTAAQSFAKAARQIGEIKATLSSTSRGAEVVVTPQTYAQAISDAIHDIRIGINHKLKQMAKRARLRVKS